jgi:two-component system, OmpR family, alkaline phosphatase synthesis response regulator PhoP
MTSARRKILIVDDDHDFSESLSAFLRAHGYWTVQAFDGPDGVRLAGLESPDLILMDVMMEERTAGFFAVQALRRDPSLDGVPIFVVSALYTAVPDFRIEPASGWLRHDAFFPKPVDLDELLRAIESHLAPAAEAIPQTSGYEP